MFYFCYTSFIQISILLILYTASLKGYLLSGSSNAKVCSKFNLVEEYKLRKHINDLACICSIDSNTNFGTNCRSFFKEDFLNQSFTREETETQFQNGILHAGGWVTKEEDRIVMPGKCNIKKILGKELTSTQFLNLFAYEKPVVIVNATDNKEFQELTTYENLIRYYGHTEVKLSSANSYSYENTVKTFKQYCQSDLKAQSLSTLANETFYFFGDNSNEEWFDLFNKYQLPPYFLPGHLSQLSFGVAGPGSGVPFHFHGPGFAETLWGRKRWFMYPPSFTPPFHPNRTTLQWLHEQYPALKRDSKLFECTLSPGELIYFPDHWWHATLNIDTTVFMSTFLSP